MKILHRSIITALITGTTMLVAAQGMPAFEDYDRNGDGAISAEELDAFRGDRRAVRAAEGRPMRNAVKAPPFDQIDLNADGVLSPEEMAEHQQQQMSKRPFGRGPSKGEGSGKGMGRNMPTFAEFDLDGDGAMTEDEFIEARGQRISERAKQGYRMRGLQNARPFSEIDQDDDGVVNESEFLQMQALHRQSQLK